MTSSTPEIILFHYEQSPYGARVVWYLNLRGIPYKQCIQPLLLPRPDLQKLKINYRRIPILSIDGDVYVDSRLIISVLETKFPQIPRLTPTSLPPATHALASLLESYTTSTHFFSFAAALIPFETPILQDPAWWKDREALFGNGKFSPEAMADMKSTALAETRMVFDLLETGLLVDGRDFVLGTSTPSVADIDVGWIVGWLYDIPGALPDEHWGPKVYPEVNSWIARVKLAVASGKSKLGIAEIITGDQAAATILSSPFAPHAGITDPLSELKAGDYVTVLPTDYGMSHSDSGPLVSITKDEVVIDIPVEAKMVRLHAPRHGFMVHKDVPKYGRSEEV